MIGAICLGLFMASFKEDVRFGAMLGAVCGASLVIPVMMLLGLIQISGLLAIVLFIFISPIIGMVGAFVFDIIITHLFLHSRQNRMKRIFQPLHVLACLVQATAHGANDGQHAVGVITALLVSSGILMTFDVPAWVILTSALAIGLGTCFGGWQVVDKMAKDITKIRPYQGFCAATASSAILVAVTDAGYPGLLNACHQRGNHRGWCNPGEECSPVAGCPRDDDGMDHHDPARGRGRVCRVFYCRFCLTVL